MSDRSVAQACVGEGKTTRNIPFKTSPFKNLSRSSLFSTKEQSINAVHYSVNY